MALVYRKQLDEKTAFAVWKIEETAEELYQQLQLKAHEQAYLETLNNGKRNLHWLSTRVLLRKMLSTSQYIDCQADEHGKPYLVNFPHQISLSHSYDYAAVMISENKGVGIDIELVKTKITRVAGKFLTRRELSFIEPGKQVEHLYICWCAKEAIYKLHGKSGISFLKDIRLDPFTSSDAGSFNASLVLPGSASRYVIHYERFHDYMIGYVTE
ncbi:4'-phosphopantetheinyl transferase family protein [Hufsiella ginkgonis]|uniref:4'-phosphopantetheinyl transferase superfamily protein n=1 Tax=Hufsiella ginkgonis TaxID=2695274 RepID=A0A7K1Y2Q4_9SPHI|nr:4'-phosphopantetheinyl transferase superfamily protein [Hufsiella ginkgonis]MXV17563.1 4'-phosphopantetheinyl transferase superfamily protein [Hufsiella ginkgonis]